MKLSITPSYLCNLKCNFCYYYDWLEDRKLLDLDILDRHLDEIQRTSPIEYIDIYGGEISILPPTYVRELCSIIEKYYKGEISIVSNFVRPEKYFFHETFFNPQQYKLFVSYDFDCRQNHNQVWTNIQAYNGDINILCVATPCLMSKNIEDMIQFFNSSHNIVSVDIKSYSSSMHNDLGVKWSNYESFMQKWISAKTKKQFTCRIEYNLAECISGSRNAWNDNHIFISPSGNMEIIQFDPNGREYFTKLESLDEFFKYANLEKEKIKNNIYCSRCTWIGKCLTEQYREVLEINNSCNGFKNLIDWYKNYVSPV
jgi:sulfatase maturation enzyme AslB (radical SAM superfamily)